MSVLSALDLSSLLMGGVTFLVVLCWMSSRRPQDLPPGPGPALPLLGHLHLVAKDPRAQFCRWRREYGEVFSLYMGQKLVVVLTSYSAIREALVSFADVFSDRPHIFVIDDLVKGKGIVASSGAMWKEQRKTNLEILRQMGMGKNVLAERIQEEITHYIRAIKDHQGAPMSLRHLTQTSISNNICSIVLGRRFPYDDEKFVKCMKCMDDNLKLLGGTALINVLPVLRYLPCDPFKVKDIFANTDTIFSFVDEFIKTHRAVQEQDPDGMEEDTDFIHCYLCQMQKETARGNVDTTLEDDNLQKCLSDLFVAGTETTSTAVQWALLFFLHYPNVQDKCFKEVSDVIGLHRPPSMSDRPKMTYFEATIYEVLRKGDIVPLSVQHATNRDIKFRGYVIPKDAVVIPDLSCILQDPEIWGDPENFRPERFIGPDGKLTRAEELIPFSIGRRMCLGESLARMELFLYLTNLLQHFRFLPPEEGQLPSLEGVFGLTHVPQPYKIRAVPRQ